MAIKVALTREEGKNAKLDKLLQTAGVETVEIPCIAHGEGEDRPRLAEALKQAWTYVAVTSPEAASVLLEGWREAGEPPLRCVSVGASTTKVLEEGGLEVVFEPTKATAKTLGAELPLDGDGKVLYPASALAQETLQSALEGRGFEVTRLNTYNTVPASWDDATTELARTVDVVTFASPSAVKVWSQRCGTGTPVACIGETSGKASVKAGFGMVKYPDAPGMAGWVQAVLDVIEDKAP